MTSAAIMLALAVWCAVRAAFTIVSQGTVTGNAGALNYAITATGNNSVDSNPSVPAAKTGTLTTRTDNTDGILTMQSGHGINTGNVISIFWAGGQQTNVTAGTVSGNSVPFSGGTGTNLPPATTAITAMIPTSEVFVLTGNNATGALAFAVPQTGDGTFAVEFMSSAPAVLLSEILTPAGAGAATWVWDGTTTNPLAGVTVATVRFSHGQTGPRSMGAQAVFN